MEHHREHTAGNQPIETFCLRLRNIPANKGTRLRLSFIPYGLLGRVDWFALKTHRECAKWTKERLGSSGDALR